MKPIIVLAIATILIVGTVGVATAEQCLSEAIAFTSSRDYPDHPLAVASAEIYLMNPDGTNPRRLTTNTAGDAFAHLSPDGKRIVFDSNRDRAPGEPLNTSDLFLMKADGKDQRRLIRGSSATWSPNGKYIAFHASASGAACTSPPLPSPPLPGTPGCPTKSDPGAPTWDSDIFIMRVPDDEDVTIEAPINITNTPGYIEDDADWHPDGIRIAFTRHLVTDNPINSATAEICVLTLETLDVACVTQNSSEERGPAWSPDGTRIVYLCRNQTNTIFEICVMNADGTGQTQLTNNSLLDATPGWSPDGQRIVFHRNVGTFQSPNQQLFVMNAKLNADGTLPEATQLTFPPGINLFPAWGVVRAQCAE